MTPEEIVLDQIKGCFMAGSDPAYITLAALKVLLERSNEGHREAIAAAYEDAARIAENAVQWDSGLHFSGQDIQNEIAAAIRKRAKE